MGFVEAVKHGFSKYAAFSGRASLPEFWWFALFVFVGGLVSGLIDYAIMGSGTPGQPAGKPVSALFHLATILPLLSAGYRRLEDSGRPGKYIFLPFLISVGAMVLLFGTAMFAGLLGTEAGTAASGMAMFGGGVATLLFYLGVLAVNILLVWWLTRPSV